MAERKPLFFSSEGFSEELAVTDSVTLGGLTLGGALNMGGHVISGLGSPGATAAQDAANKGYVDAVVHGLDPKPAVKAYATIEVLPLSGLTASVDGVNLDTDGNRVLLNDQSNAVNNGIWEVHSGPWTRPVDFPVGYASSGVYMFVTSGIFYKHTGWICASLPGADIVGTSPLHFIEFNGGGEIAAGPGLAKLGDILEVKSGDGIFANGGVSLNLGEDGGLVFEGMPGSAVLSALVAPSEGMQIDGALGLALFLSNTTLQTGASGVSVKGVPSTWEVAGQPTSASAAWLDILTAGATSLADMQHTHTAVYADSTRKVQGIFTSKEALGFGDPVYSSANNGISRADTVSDAKARIQGIALDTVTGSGLSVRVCSKGLAEFVVSGATFGTPYYLQLGGGIGTEFPPGGNRLIMLGYTYDADSLVVRVVDYGKTAL